MKKSAMVLAAVTTIVAGTTPSIARELRMAYPWVIDPITGIFIERLKSFDDLKPADLSITFIFGQSTLEMLRAGNIDLALLPASALQRPQADSPPAPYLTLMAQPLTTDSPREQIEVQDSIYGDMIAAEIGRQGLIRLAYWNRASVPLVAKRPVSSKDGLRGFRVPSLDLPSNRLIIAMGASPTFVPSGDIFTAMTTGSIDASEFWYTHDHPSLPVLNGGAFIADYRQPLGFLIASQTLWVDLTESQRLALSAAAKAAEAKAREAVLAAHESQISVARSAQLQFVKFTDLDRSFVDEKAPTVWLQGLDNSGRQALDLLNRVKLEAKRSRPRRGGTLPPARLPAVMFATPRKDERHGSLVKRFGLRPVQDPVVSCGSVDYQADLDRTLGGSHKGPLSLTENVVTNRACVAAIADAAGSSGGEVIILIHGFRYSMEDALRFAVGVASDLKANAPLVVWSWPSAGRVEMYRYDEESVEWSRPYFQTMLGELLSHQAIKHVTIVSHSMGGRLALMGLETAPAPAKSLGGIVWVAPDVAISIFNDRLNHHSPKAKRATLYATTTDRALRISTNWHDETRAGLAGPSLVVRKGLDTIDATTVESSFVNHTHAFDVPEAAADLRALVVEGKLAEHRNLTKATVSQGLSYWQIERAP